jgi:hypothetical protein
VLVFAQVKLHNQSNKPLFLYEILTNATLEDGVHASYAAPKSEYERVFLAYPECRVPHGKALSLDTTIDPGQTQEGTVVSPVPRDQTAVGRAQGPELHLQVPVPAQPGAHAPRRGY